MCVLWRFAVLIIVALFFPISQTASQSLHWLELGKGIRVDPSVFKSIFSKVSRLLEAPTSYQDFYAGLALLRLAQNGHVENLRSAPLNILQRDQLLDETGAILAEIQKILMPITQVRPGHISIIPPTELEMRATHAVSLLTGEQLTIETPQGVASLGFSGRKGLCARMFMEGPFRTSQQNRQRIKKKDRTTLLLLQKLGNTILLGEGEGEVQVKLANLTDNVVWLSISAPPLTRVRRVSKSDRE